MIILLSIAGEEFKHKSVVEKCIKITNCNIQWTDIKT